MSDFRLSGQLEIVGITGLEPHLNNLRRKLDTLKVDKTLAEAGKSVSVSLERTASSASKTKKEIFAATNNLQDFSDKAALALRRFTAFSLAAGATFGSLRLIVGGLKDAANFQRELVKVQQVSGASANNIADLRDQISKLGRSLGAPAQELAKVSTTLSQAGYSIVEVKKLLETISLTRLAATFGTVEQTIEGIIAISGQFGIAGKDMQSVLSSINSVAAKYALEAGDLIEAVKRTGGVFAAVRGDVSDANVAIAEFNALVGSVRQTTRMPSETIATGLRTVLARLQRPDTLTFFKSLGVELTDLQGKFIGPYQAIKRIQEAIAGLDTRDPKFAQIVEVLGGVRQLGVVIPLLTQARLQQEIFNTSLEGTNSLLKDAQLPLTTITERLNQLSAAWSELSRNVFESKTFQFLATESINLAQSLVRVADSIAPLIPIFTLLGGLRLGAAVAKSGAVGTLVKRLSTGHPGFAAGGYIPGSGSGDKIPILAEPGEFVIKKSAARKLGASTLHALNNDIPKYATGGGVGNTPETNEIFKEYRNLAKSLNISSKEFLKVANEARQTAKSVNEYRKLLAGGIQAFGQEAKQIAKNSIADQLAKDEARAARANTPLAGGGTSSGGLNIPLTPGAISAQKAEEGRERSRAALQQRNREATRRRVGSLVFEQSLLDAIKTPTKSPSSSYVGTGLVSTSPQIPTSLEQRKLQALKIARQARLIDSATNTEKAHRVALGAINDTRYGPGQRTLFNMGGPQIPVLPELTEADTFNRNISQADLYSSGLSRVQRVPRRLPGFARQGLSRLRTHARLARQSIGSGLRGMGSNVSAADPLTLAALSAGVDYGGQALGYDRTTTAPISGALGGASAGKLFLGGKYGAAIGAAVGGTTAFFSSQKEARLAKPTEDLEKNTNDLADAFEDLKNGVGGAGARVDQLLQKQQELQNQLNDAKKTSFKDTAKAVGTGAASLLPFLPRSLLTKAGGGLLGLGGRGAGIVAAHPVVAATAAAVTGTFFGGRAAYRAGAGYGDENLGFVKNVTLGAPKKGQTIGGDLAYKAFEQDVGITKETQETAAANKDQAEQARRLITSLQQSGRGGQISDQLILTALGDNAAIQQGFANASSVTNKNSTLTEDAQKKRNLEATQRNQINLYREQNINPIIAAQKRAEELAKALDLSFKAADLFANKLDRASNLLEVFGANLEQSKVSIDNVFNEANGNFQINRNLANPFDNIAGLNKGQISNQLGSIESFLGVGLDEKLKGTLTSIPTLERLPEIINDKIATTNRLGGTIPNVGGFVTDLLNRKTGELGGLPDAVKKDLMSVFSNLDNSQATAFLSGDTSNRHTQAINESLNQTRNKSVDFVKKLQDSVNNFLKLQDAAGNQRSGLLSSQTRLGANYANVQADFIENRRARQNRPLDPFMSVELQRNSLRSLTGLRDPTAQNIGDNINKLMQERAAIEASVNIGEAEKIKRLSEVNSRLTTNKEALDKLASSAVGLAAIQQKLQEVEGRRLGLADKVISDALGGNTEERQRSDLAFKLFQENNAQGRNGLQSVYGTGFLSREDLARGIQQEEQRLSLFQGKEAAEEFKLSTAQTLATQAAGFTLTPAESKQAVAGFKDLNQQRGKLLNAADNAEGQQLDAISEQRRLLGESISKFDDVVTNRFVAGISQLGEIAKSLNIPESVSIQATHIHQFQFSGLDFNNMTPYFKQIAEEAINKALSNTTDGKVKQGIIIPNARNK